ncbi:MAG: alpha/beta fold hydrolase [Turneriella sp.]
MVPYIRERLELPDGDFVDLDWSRIHSKKLVIITHGMEGSSRSKYVLHTVMRANKLGYSAVAWNMRGCSGQSNRKIHFYHSGKTEDLDLVIKHALRSGYSGIYLVGFSLGGNLTLLYLAQQASAIHRSIKSAVAISAPVDLVSSQQQIELPENRIYLARFLKDFRKKFRKKRKDRKIYIDVRKFRDEVKTLAHLDARYTAPWNGFASELQYYQQCSSKPLLHKIAIPALLINPKDDTFLSPDCYPYTEAKNSRHFYLETPEKGGHCAMLLNHAFNESYMENRIFEFLESQNT